MPAQVNITNVDAYGQSIYITFNVVLSGAYTVGGDTLNFTGSGTLPVGVDPQFVGLLPAVESSSCLNADVWSQGGGSIGAANQTLYNIVLTKTGTPSIISPATGIKIKVAALATPSTPAEHAGSSYESQYTGDFITGMAVFTKLL